MKGKMIMKNYKGYHETIEKRQQVILHLKDNRYVSIVQDKDDTCEIAIVTEGFAHNGGGVDSDTVKRYLNTQELAIELLKFNLDR